MEFKKHVKNWFQLVKIAISKHYEKYKKDVELNVAYDKVRKAVSIYDTPNTDLDKTLGIQWCEIKYCPENWNGSLHEDDPNTQSHPCPYFRDEKCTKECLKQSDNHKYFDAKAAFDTARQEHIDALKRVFGKRTKKNFCLQYRSSEYKIHTHGPIV